MSGEESGDPGGDGDAPNPPALEGRDVEAAVEAVLEARPDADRETVRRTLDPATEDGTVARSALEPTLAEASKVLMTAESRAENAEHELADAREAAADAPDLAVVTDRLETHAARLEAVQDRADALGEALQALLDRAGESAGLYDAAVALREVTGDAQAVTQDADALAMDCRDLVRWLESPPARTESLSGDLDALSGRLDRLDEAIHALERRAAVEAEAGATAGEPAPADADPGRGETGPSAAAVATGSRDADPADQWLAVAVDHRVTGLLLADLRAEVSALETWADREAAGGDHRESLAEQAERLGDLEARHAHLEDHLADPAVEGWDDEHADALAALEADVADLEPPVDWGAVQAAVEAHRPAGVGATRGA